MDRTAADIGKLSYGINNANQYPASETSIEQLVYSHRSLAVYLPRYFRGELRERFMKPKIDKTKFGTIIISGTKYDNDVIIRLGGRVEKRKKKLSKAIYGTSHIISLDEAKYVYEEGAERLIVGTGQSGMAKLSDEAAEYLKDKGCRADLQPTPEAIQLWNEAKGAVIALFHVTC